MSNTIKMARLDFITMKSNYLSYLSGVFVVLLFLFMGSTFVLVSVNCAWVVALISTMIFMAQEKNDLNRLYGTFSITIRDIVLGRFLYVVSIYLALFLITTFLYAIYSFIQSVPFDLVDFTLGLGISFLVFSIIVGIQMPLFFKLGYMKGRMWSLLAFLLVIAIITIPVLIYGPGAVFSTLPIYGLVHTLGSLLLGIVVLFISWKASVAAYR